jgi:hypothetical protein
MARTALDPVHGGEADRWGGWSWRKPSHGEHFRTCSYCGSIHPEDLANESGWAADWADRKYGWPHKFYVQVPNRAPGQRYVIGATSADQPHGDGTGWLPSSDVPDDVNSEGWRDLATSYRWVLIGTRATHHAKFYSVHLADPAIQALALDRIQAASGLRFRFADGRVSWAPAR